MPEKLIDKLDRQDYIKFIENLILNSDSYKRDNDSKSYVMALDSAWGTGKSYFIDLLIQDIDEQDNIFVVKYNAWANDYCDNAFNPLIYDILKSDALIFDTEEVTDVKNVKKIASSIAKIGLTIGKQVLNKKINDEYGIDIDEAVNQTLKAGEDLKNFLFRTAKNLEELNNQRASFEELKSFLTSVTKWMQNDKKKLVVIIDELDRCKPTFAIQTLEIVKHIFDVENIVFLFAVDIEQLSHSISSVYGQEFDSVGYLCRFFDYIAKLPNPAIENFVSYKFDEIGLNRQDPKIIKMHAYILKLVEHFNLSLRDLDTVLQSYKILNNTKLNEYEILDAHFVYLFYLTLKYKMPSVYYGIFLNKSETFSNESKFKLDKLCSFLNDLKNVFLTKSFEALKNTNKIYALKMAICVCEEIDYKDISIEKISKQRMEIKNSLQSVQLGEYTNWGHILFYPDLLKWEDICTYTYKEYIHKQLENYNFIDSNTIKNENIYN